MVSHFLVFVTLKLINPLSQNCMYGTPSLHDPTILLSLQQVCQYDYNAPGFSEATGHFTQLVWASSSAIGCSLASLIGSMDRDAELTFIIPGKLNAPELSPAPEFHLGISIR